MPHFEHGFKTALIGMVTGLVLTIFLKEIAPSLGEQGGAILIMFNLLSIASIIVLMNNVPHWGISYALGWLAGLFLFGGYFMSRLELSFYILIIGFSLVIKITNKF